MGVVLAVLILSAAAADTAPPVGCPTDEDVQSEIGRLGAAPALAQLGTTDITVEGASMRIVLRGRDGMVLGRREVAAPDTCQERAAVAAVVIVAWLGHWSGGEPSPPPSPPPSAPAASPQQRRLLTLAPRRQWRADVAAFVFGAHDGDAVTGGLGIQAGYGLGEHLSLIAFGDGTGERVRPLGPGQAAYRTVRFGAGLALRRVLGRAFIDGGVAPEAVRFSLQGEGLAITRGATLWGLAVDARGRLGLRLAGVVPFLHADASYALTTARLTLDNRPDSVTLSRWSFAAGLGLLFSFGPLGG